MVHDDGSCLTRQLRELPPQLVAAYKLENVLGAGAFAVVHRITHRNSGDGFALKVVDKAPLRARNMLPQLQREITQLREHMDTPHIVRLIDVIETVDRIAMRFELCERSLASVVECDGPMEEQEASAWLREACLGVQCLHECGLIHRDLKPGNWLVDAENSLRICDFGWCCLESDRLSGMCGTPQYAPPEQRWHGGGPHTRAADLYSLGASLQHLLRGQPLQKPGGIGEMPAIVTKQAARFASALMRADAASRPNIDDTLEHPWLEDSEGLASSAASLVEDLWGRGKAWLIQGFATDDEAHAQLSNKTSDAQPSSVPTPATTAPSSKAPSPVSSMASLQFSDVNGTARGVLLPSLSTDFMKPPSLYLPPPLTFRFSASTGALPFVPSPQGNLHVQSTRSLGGRRL